jgi:hypothetical protein
MAFLGGESAHCANSIVGNDHLVPPLEVVPIDVGRQSSILANQVLGVVAQPLHWHLIRKANLQSLILLI